MWSILELSLLLRSELLADNILERCRRRVSTSAIIMHRNANCRSAGSWTYTKYEASEAAAVHRTTSTASSQSFSVQEPDWSPQVPNHKVRIPRMETVRCEASQ